MGATGRESFKKSSRPSMLRMGALVHLIVASPFDDSTKALLTGAFDNVVSALAAENADHQSDPGLQETIARAILDLAIVGQRDTAQLERYAESRARRFLRGQLTA